MLLFCHVLLYLQYKTYSYLVVHCLVQGKLHSFLVCYICDIIYRKLYALGFVTLGL